MNTFPIELDRYFFTRLCVVSNRLHVQKEQLTAERLSGPESALAVTPIEGEDRLFLATQTVKLEAEGKPDYPYSVDIECVGFFRVVEDGMSTDKQQAGVTMVAHSVLYAACREAVLNATGRQAWGPFTLGLSVLQGKAESD